MSVDGTSLGDRMKGYEHQWRTPLPRNDWCVLRVDVRAAHTYLRHATKPFDPAFSAAMARVAEALCAEVQGALLAYTQSDECSVVYRAAGPKAEPWFGGVIAKQVSISASAATAVLNAHYQRTSPWPRGVEYEQAPPPVATFDSRVFTLPSEEEVENYLIWRQRDARRNSVSMVAQAEFSHRQLQGRTGGDMKVMLAERGIDYDALDQGDRQGRETRQNSGERIVQYLDRRTGDTHTGTALRTWWGTTPAPLYVVGQVGLSG